LWKRRTVFVKDAEVDHAPKRDEDIAEGRDRRGHMRPAEAMVSAEMIISPIAPPKARAMIAFCTGFGGGADPEPSF
jgi:hypothetical protein